MYAHTETAHAHRSPASMYSALAGRDDTEMGPLGLHRERAWRQPAAAVESLDILASRWTDARDGIRREQADGSPDRYVLGVALRPVRVRLARGAHPLFEGTMPGGMVHVTAPGQPLQAEFFTPCDFVHFHVAAPCFHRHLAASGAGNVGDLMVRDDLAARLGHTLTEGMGASDPFYAESVGQTILMRLLAHRPAPPKVSPLSKWRLKRVQEHVDANIAETITLSDLARAAGLSRMHFAAQFRVATGCRPHEYLLQHRVECAKAMLLGARMPLVEIALNVGFQTQSHFSTVFKRLAGDTPGSWQRANIGCGA